MTPPPPRMPDEGRRGNRTEESGEQEGVRTREEEDEE